MLATWDGRSTSHQRGFLVIAHLDYTLMIWYLLLYIYIRVYIYKRIYIYIIIHTHIYIYIQTHIYIHTHTHIYIHTYDHMCVIIRSFYMASNKKAFRTAIAGTGWSCNLSATSLEWWLMVSRDDYIYRLLLGYIMIYNDIYVYIIIYPDNSLYNLYIIIFSNNSLK